MALEAIDLLGLEGEASLAFEQGGLFLLVRREAGRRYQQRGMQICFSIKSFLSGKTSNLLQ